MNNFLINLITLTRPKFLFYSFFLHSVGALFAYLQTNSFDTWTFFWVQFTVWITHLMTHLYNEYYDLETDKLNIKAGAYTGGSKILAQNKISPKTAIIFAIGMTMISIYGGINVLMRIAPHNQLSFFSHGFSVLFVAIAYTKPPFKLCYRGMGELCVSYVLCYCTPYVGLITQNGHITWEFLTMLFPLIVFNGIRMIVMNIPDKHSDQLSGKSRSFRQHEPSKSEGSGSYRCGLYFHRGPNPLGNSPGYQYEH